MKGEKRIITIPMNGDFVYIHQTIYRLYSNYIQTTIK